MVSTEPHTFLLDVYNPSYCLYLFLLTDRLTDLLSAGGTRAAATLGTETARMLRLLAPLLRWQALWTCPVP